MPRQARLNLPGVLYHVMARGIERRDIFQKKIDYLDFIDRLKIALKLNGCQCFAWSLLPNHFHLLIRSGKVGITSMMRELMTGYAMGFNHRYHRCGHWFANRYKSILCEEEPYVRDVAR